MKNKHLLSVKDLSKDDIKKIFSYASEYKKNNNIDDILKGRHSINIFFEPSTRTSLSFEMAAKNLGMHSTNLSIKSSSAEKGEIDLDTIITIDAMSPHFLVIRHPESLFQNLCAQHVKNAIIINAGDGCHEHPTQGLIDLFTIMERFPNPSGLTMCICGDILHSRTMRSCIPIMQMFGMNIRFAMHPIHKPCEDHMPWNNIDIYTEINEGLEEADIIMCLRQQKEKQILAHPITESNYSSFCQLNEENIKHAKKDALIMHPGPINRNIEITDALMYSKRSLILNQVQNGMPMRRAVFKFLSEL